MRKFVYFVFFLLICSSCVRNSIDENDKGLNSSRTLKSILTKSSSMVQEDTIVKMSKLQSDVDNLMMGRVIMQDSYSFFLLKRRMHYSLASVKKYMKTTLILLID